MSSDMKEPTFVSELPTVRQQQTMWGDEHFEPDARYHHWSGNVFVGFRCAAFIHSGIHKRFASVADVAVVFWQIARKYVGLTMNSAEHSLDRYIRVISLGYERVKLPSVRLNCHRDGNIKQAES